MSAAQTDFFASLGGLFRKGVRYSTVIDIGCADGQFFLNLSAMGIDSGAVPLNVDANALYEESLKSIKNVVGGDCRIGAVTNHVGELELTTSAHPYWSSVRDEGDIYWKRLNKLSGKKVVVPATTLDLLCEQLSLKGPFLLKLDVQGAEAQVLEGASEALKNTHVVVCEADVDDFQTINACLVKNDFILYDLTHMNRLADETLGWFYPIYVHRSIDFVLPGNFWEDKEQSTDHSSAGRAAELDPEMERSTARTIEEQEACRRSAACVRQHERPAQRQMRVRIGQEIQALLRIGSVTSRETAQFIAMTTLIAFSAMTRPLCSTWKRQTPSAISQP